MIQKPSVTSGTLLRAMLCVSVMDSILVSSGTMLDLVGSARATYWFSNLARSCCALRHRVAAEPLRTVRFGHQPPRRSLAVVTGLHPIVLQKSFCTGGQKFCGPQARFPCKDVRGP